jgi:phosphoribosylcarboxyaminoimidazole (NCAIR) mutase
MWYILTGIKIGAAANAAVFAFNVLMEVENHIIEKAINHANKKINSTIKDEQPDTSDDLK